MSDFVKEFENDIKKAAHRIRQQYGLEVVPDHLMAYVNLAVTDGLTPYAFGKTPVKSGEILGKLANYPLIEIAEIMESVVAMIERHGDTVFDQNKFPYMLKEIQDDAEDC